MARDHGSRKDKSSEKVTLRFDVNLLPGGYLNAISVRQVI